MTDLILYLHPLSSYSWKALIALYENGTAFTPAILDAEHPENGNALAAVWPIGKFPVLHDRARDRWVPETSILIEYVTRLHPGHFIAVPHDADAALEVRLWDRIFDQHVMTPMQMIVRQRLGFAGKNPIEVEQETARLYEKSYPVVEAHMAGRQWAAGDFSLADCAAFPALYYADQVAPLEDRFPAIRAYLNRLSERPSIARVVKEAEPYFHMFPKE